MRVYSILILFALVTACGQQSIPTDQDSITENNPSQSLNQTLSETSFSLYPSHISIPPDSSIDFQIYRISPGSFGRTNCKAITLDSNWKWKVVESEGCS